MKPLPDGGRLWPIFKKKRSKSRYGQFITFPPGLTKTHIFAAKDFLRAELEAHEKKLKKRAKNVEWIIDNNSKTDQDQDQSVVGWRAEFV